MLIGITYPRKELENVDKSRRKNENKSSLNRVALFRLQGSGTIYGLVV
jgi:hypothetical protein